MNRMTPGAPVQFVDRKGQVMGGVIARVHLSDEQTPEGTVDLIVWDPLMLCPQPARLVPYVSEAQISWDGTRASWSWHWIDPAC